MNQSTIIFNKFSTGIYWNGVSYSIYKICSSFIMFSLYALLNSEEFSLWATINSITFLVILWIDGGLRKSIPCYTPEFTKNKTVYKHFIITLITIQFLTIVCSMPFVWKAFTILTKKTHIISIIIYYYAIIIFFTESLIALIKLVFHSHFWQKEFNIIYTFFMLIETILNFFAIYFLQLRSLFLIQWLFLIKIITTSCIIFFSTIIFLRKYNTVTQNTINTISNNNVLTKPLIKSFLIHTIMMWASTFIKSLSERNFLLPFLTITIGAAYANMFKIAQEGALFFQRMILKTIGTSDTSLLAYIESNKLPHDSFIEAFNQLIKKTTLICFPLLFLGLTISFKTRSCMQDTTIPTIFLILICGYILEIILSPYERILETKHNYKYLWLSYIPYIITISILFFTSIAQNYSITAFTLFIQLIRIFCSILMAYFAQKYKITFPFKFVFLCIIFSLVFFLLLMIITPTNYCSFQFFLSRFK